MQIRPLGGKQASDQTSSVRFALSSKHIPFERLPKAANVKPSFSHSLWVEIAWLMCYTDTDLIDALFTEGASECLKSAKDSKGPCFEGWRKPESKRHLRLSLYRYPQENGVVFTPKSLTELRKKEDELWRDLADGIDYAAGEMTVADLVDRYMNLKRGLKPNSLRSYNTAVKRIHADLSGKKLSKR